jgi:hypothetical protein
MCQTGANACSSLKKYAVLNFIFINYFRKTFAKMDRIGLDDSIEIGKAFLTEFHIS